MLFGEALNGREERCVAVWQTQNSRREVWLEWCKDRDPGGAACPVCLNDCPPVRSGKEKPEAFCLRSGESQLFLPLAAGDGGTGAPFAGALGLAPV